MGNNETPQVCPLELANSLDSNIRRWLQNPHKMLAPYFKTGMTVLDLGCGPGFFTLEIARLVGKSGHVIAADLQAGMLQRVKDKIAGTELESRISLHQCANDKIGLAEKVDFVLVFYMAHEVPHQEALFSELSSLLNPQGQILVVEPPVHVSKKDFEAMINKAKNAGLAEVDRPKMSVNKAVILQKD